MVEERPVLLSKDEYIVSQELLSVKDTYVIKDEHKNEIGKAKRELLSLGPKIHIYNTQEEEMGHIEGALITLRNKMDFENWHGEEVGTLKQKLLKFIGTEYWVENPQGEHILRIEGDFTGHNFEFFDQSGKKVAEVGEAWISLGDHYGVRLTEAGMRQDVDPFLILSSVLSIDVAQKSGGGSWLRKLFGCGTCIIFFILIFIVFALLG